MSYKNTSNSFNKVIEISLILWIKSLCKDIKNIKLNIEGLNLGILNHTIKCLSLKAYNVNFNDIIIEKLELASDQIDLSFNILKKNKSLITINKEFKVSGEIVLKEDGLNLMLSSDPWNSIGAWLTKNFSNSNDFVELTFKQDHLVLKSKNSTTSYIENNSIYIETIDGNIFLKDEDSKRVDKLPMDKLIYINQAIINDSKLSIILTSNVYN